jgi:outer membrane murein-binding lipoprotein Lpp
MKKLLILILSITLVSTFLLAVCTAKNNLDALQKQIKTLQDDNAALKQQNIELSQFRDRVLLSLSKIEDTLSALKAEGVLPYAGTQVTNPKLISAIKDIRLVGINTEQDEYALIMQPREWSPDFNNILVVYDVYKLTGDMTKDKAGTITQMAGIFKNINGKWELVKFTRTYKGDGSFTLKNI